MSTSLLKEIVQCCNKNDVLLVVDECFIEFLPEWREHSVKELAAHTKNLIVTDAFTKTYSLAGFCSGFCISGNTNLLKKCIYMVRVFSIDTGIVSWCVHLWIRSIWKKHIKLCFTKRNG